MRSDEELRKTFNISFDDDDFLNVKFIDPISDSKEDNIKRAMLVRSLIYEILDKNPEKKYKIIVDASEMNESNLPNESNKIYQEVAKRKEFLKVAVIGDPDKQTTLVKYVVPFIQIFVNKASWFPNIDEARIWLKEN